MTQISTTQILSVNLITTASKWDTTDFWYMAVQYELKRALIKGELCVVFVGFMLGK